MRLTALRSESSFIVAFAKNAGAASSADAGEAERIPLAEHFRLMRRLTETSRDETLHLSKRPLAPGTTDFVIETLMQADTLEDAMKRTARAYNLVHGGYYNRVNRRRDRLVYAIDDTDFPYAFDVRSDGAYGLMEGLLIFLHALLSLRVDSDLTSRLRCVRSRRPSRVSAGGFLDFWPAPVRCGGAVYALEYDIAACALPMRRWCGGPPNAAAVYDIIDAMIAERERSGAIKPLRAKVIEAIAEGIDDQGEIARRLGLSIATLRRRLADEGATFRELRSIALNESAVAMLSQGRPIGDVAEALGYVDIRSFSRAFKAWNGVTPAAFAQEVSREA